MPEAPQAREFQPRKLPAQRRSRETFEALVEACARLLPRLGYAGTSTNHVAEEAGVGIASLYEYFPGKDAIVAQVAEQLVQRVLGRLAEQSAAVLQAPEDEAVRRWIELIHTTVEREKELVCVFVYQVPYTNRLDAVRALSPGLVAFSQAIRRRAGPLVRQELSPASMHLLIGLVTSTIMQLIVDPPADVTPRELLDELIRRVEAWVR